jgi:hypothetical protein
MHRPAENLRVSLTRFLSWLQDNPGPQKVKLSGAQLTMTEALKPPSPLHSHSLLSDLSTRQHRCSAGSAAGQGRGKPAWGGNGTGGQRAGIGGPLTAGVRGSYRRCVYREEKERERGHCLEVAGETQHLWSTSERLELWECEE